MPETCHVCGRPLIDKQSVETGVGPSCAVKSKAQQQDPKLFRAEYFTEYLAGIFVIFDRNCGSTSVTNDIERILLNEQQQRGVLPRTVIYRDSIGRYDKVRHRNGVFGGFQTLRAASLSDALAKLQEGI